MNRKLLIIEDDPGLQSQLRWCFNDIEVHLADDEETAVSIFNNEDRKSVV